LSSQSNPRPSLAPINTSKKTMGRLSINREKRHHSTLQNINKSTAN
jgi:hypothetical protein